MNATDLSELDGKIVLVSSARDHRNPPTGVRGTIRVREEPRGGLPSVQIEFDLPQMFKTRAHHRTVALTEGQVAELQASNYDGTFAITLPERIDPEAPPTNE